MSCEYVPPRTDPTTPVKLFLVPVADNFKASKTRYTSAHTTPPPARKLGVSPLIKLTSFILRRLIVTPLSALDAPLKGDVPPPSIAK